jgi:hypothetical protein
MVSSRLIAALAPEELDQIVMHEHAHLARYDDWLRFIQSAVTALCGLHPAVHFISARIDLEREAACDDRVVSQTGAADRYASCLANAADLGCRQPLSLEPILAPHASQSRGALVTRVRRLLDPRTSRDAHLKWASTAASVLAFATAVVISPAAQPLVVVLGAMTGALPLDVAPAVRRTEWRSHAFAPSLPSMADALPSGWYPGAARARVPETQAISPDPGSMPPPISIDRQLSWTMPAGIVPVAAPPAGSNRPLPATPLAPWSSAATGSSPPGQPLKQEPGLPADSAWRAAGSTGVTLGQGVARAGVITGSGSRKAGAAVADFFSGAGKVVADGF